jgi:hypothetical protein
MRLMAALSVLLGLLAAAAGCEVLARVFLRGGISDRVEIVDQGGGVQADCYPAARAVHMTFDLREPGQGVAFFRNFHRMQIGWPGATDVSRENDPIPKTESAEEALVQLRASAPFCMLYDTRDTSPRFLDEPRGFTHSMALLGDSFTFGQGASEELRGTGREHHRDCAAVRKGDEGAREIQIQARGVRLRSQRSVRE